MCLEINILKLNCPLSFYATFLIYGDLCFLEQQ